MDSGSGFGFTEEKDMGTRADFYVGRGKDSEWLGSIAWDGYPDGIPDAILGATNSDEFREVVADLLRERSDGTTPEMGWPWPWDDSNTTDYAYAFDGAKVHGSCFGHDWFDPKAEANDDGDYEESGGPATFPNMKAVQNVNHGERSGVIFVSVKG